jgi:hypothetical protein
VDCATAASQDGACVQLSVHHLKMGLRSCFLEQYWFCYKRKACKNKMLERLKVLPDMKKQHLSAMFSVKADCDAPFCDAGIANDPPLSSSSTDVIYKTHRRQ